ncbi:hypothetical protein CYMTET_46541 [Cymbomonas tetramitiformis]|uniref:Calmodulin n=1 Tax=Cymbomonas tetramitiformis TaxID=36881 RepID=A0AAE0BVY5_9CHLO|nr:hypothetical protein CYMTET_46541 [Cymbomonas tetramitiformis]
MFGLCSSSNSDVRYGENAGTAKPQPSAEPVEPPEVVETPDEPEDTFVVTSLKVTKSQEAPSGATPAVSEDAPPPKAQKKKNRRASAVQRQTKVQREVIDNHEVDMAHIIPSPTAGKITDTYELSEVLGNGVYGPTRIVKHLQTGEELGCKSVLKVKLANEDNVMDFQREVEILQLLSSSSGVIGLKEVYEDADGVHLVTDLCTGGDLVSKIRDSDCFSEKRASQLFGGLMVALEQCHSNGVIHRDVKLDNVLLTDNSENPSLKLIDFTIAAYARDCPLCDVVGTASYVAPEVLRGEYGMEVDIWSAGVTLFAMLSGELPFEGPTENDLYGNILRAAYNLEADPWHVISVPAKDLISKMLVKNPADRITATEVLKHPWLTLADASEFSLLDIVVPRMRAFTLQNDFKRAGKALIATNLTTEQLDGLREIFAHFDLDADGCITFAELQMGLRRRGYVSLSVEVDEMMAKMDVNRNSSVDYAEFLAATLHTSKLSSSEYLWDAFRKIDADNSGHITEKELHEAMDELGIKMPSAEMMKAMDLNGDGLIDYEEFSYHMSCETWRAAGSKGKYLREPPVYVLLHNN